MSSAEMPEPISSEPPENVPPEGTTKPTITEDQKKVNHIISNYIIILTFLHSINSIQQATR